MAGVLDTAQKSDMPLISAVGVSTISSNDRADVILICSIGLDLVFCFVPGHVEDFNFLAGLVVVFCGVIVDLEVTLLSRHEMSLCFE